VAGDGGGRLTAIAGVNTAAVLAPPQVKARVQGRGAKRVLRWTLRPAPGQRVTFAEEGSDSAKVIARTAKRRGTVRFTPATGNARKRRVVAIVEQGGAPRATIAVARYTAPAWRRPAKPRALRVKRKGTSLIATWKGAAGAVRWMVYATAGDGEREVFVLPARRRKLRIADVRRDERAVVEVAGLRSDDLAGPRARVKAKAVRAHPAEARAATLRLRPPE
jgi:hypothetical protein